MDHLSEVEMSDYERRAFKVALRVLERHLRTEGVLLDKPAAVVEYLRLRLAALDFEIFSVMFLDSQNRLIVHEELFRGTLNQTAVYPREVVKRALHLGAAAVLLAHDHPSGVAEASPADLALTRVLKEALGLVGVAVLDHIIVAGRNVYSFAEHGRI